MRNRRNQPSEKLCSPGSKRTGADGSDLPFCLQVGSGFEAEKFRMKTLSEIVGIQIKFQEETGHCAKHLTVRE